MYLWFLFSVLNLSSAPTAPHPPARWFSLDVLVDTTGKTTDNCCSSQPTPPNLSLTAYGMGEGCCRCCLLFTRMGRGCISSPRSRFRSAGLIRSCKHGLSPLAFGIRCNPARTLHADFGLRGSCSSRSCVCWQGFLLACSSRRCLYRHRVPLFPSVIHI